MRREPKILLGMACVIVVAVAGVIGLRTLWDQARDSFGYDHCTVGGYDLSPDQASVAATMVGAVAKFEPGLPKRAGVLVLMAALQESKLENLPPGAGDRDSVGVLQQRPSQGWGDGDVKQLTDVGQATTLFLQAMVKLPDWRTRPPAAVIQDVQVSVDGSLYEQHRAQATALARALDGRRPAAITCDFDAPTKVATPARVAQLVAADLPVNPPTTDRNTVRVRGARWQTAAWFVAYSHQLGIERVSHDGRTWSRRSGWQRSDATADAVVAELYAG